MPVIFDEKPVLSTRSKSAKRGSFITGFFLKTGLVKTEKGAQVLMVIVILIVGALWLYVADKTNVQVEPPSREEVIFD